MKRFISILFLYFFLSKTYALVNTFYVLHADLKNAITQIENYRNLVNIIIAQAYNIDKTGAVSGTVDNEIKQVSAKHSLRLLGLVTNAKFDPDVAHIFLSDKTAQLKALSQLIAECKKNNLAGLQFDFEMVRLKDRDLLTQFYTLAATLLHQHHLQISFAIAPILTDKNFATMYQKKLYEVWQGAYDFKKLGEVGDFVTIMTYDQHARGTTPGAIASVPWDMEVIHYALRLIPSQKISLGIPTYSGLWYMAMNPRSGSITIHYDSVDFKTVKYILEKNKLYLHWDNINQVNYAFYDVHGVNKYLFVENAKSFAAKFALAIQYQLYGISVFRLGIEDPGIWGVLMKHEDKRVMK